MNRGGHGRVGAQINVFCALGMPRDRRQAAFVLSDAFAQRRREESSELA